MGELPIKDVYGRNIAGKLVMCESREDDSTRLFPHRFDKYISMGTKEGWGDLFTHLVRMNS